jgi:lysophospholipase L1-like esterase
LLFSVGVLLLIVRAWGYETTSRCYLEHRVDARPTSVASQRFDVEGAHVVPRIVTKGPDRLSFAYSLHADATVRVSVLTEKPVHVVIERRLGDAIEALRSQTIRGETAVDAEFPTGNGIITFVSDGPVVWTDPRVVRHVRVVHHAWWLTLLVVAGAFVYSGFTPVHRAAYRRFCFSVAAPLLSLVATLVLCEAVLRVAGWGISGIAAARHDLGDVSEDPRWQETVRYGRRLRPNIDAMNEWRHGDIVRGGYIPEAVSPGTLHRFPFSTDREGFRNQAVRDRFDVAALGDSFTDALTMNSAGSWPSQLERRFGLSVQNYGTAGFGPQQEALVLHDYVARHRPRRVILAYFAGNDLFDAEAFDDFQASGGTRPRGQAGWRIKEVFSRADTWFIVGGLSAAFTQLGHAAESPAGDARNAMRQEGGPANATPASFDRGMFTATVNGQRIQWAYMPPYLNTLTFSEDELRGRRGWRLTEAALRDMQQTTHSFGGELIIMFLPFKSQVYWSLMERVVPVDAIEAALRFYLEGNQRPLDLEAMRRNRLAQNRLLRGFCEREQIPFLDVTAALEQRAATGHNVYFPDESHLNEDGNSVVAETLAVFLTSTATLVHRHH